MNRREFGHSLLGGFVVLMTARAEPSPVGADDLASCLPKRLCASAVGAAYLSKYPEHASKAVLRDHLALPAGSLTRAQVAAELTRQISGDFAHQRTLVLDGWLLSRTEAAICGLIALG